MYDIQVVGHTFCNLLGIHKNQCAYSTTEIRFCYESNYSDLRQQLSMVDVNTFD